jgi:hypothetical protein
MNVSNIRKEVKAMKLIMTIEMDRNRNATKRAIAAGLKKKNVSTPGASSHLDHALFSSL